ncbi:MAG: acyl-CoA dehydrogenase family protein [Armatimonadetes bacterium]|nr:acyl-CoA dehydrogenase family protein [Armatimonadota bacterium]
MASLESQSIPATGCSFLQGAPASAFAPEDFSSDERLMVQMAEQFSQKEILPNLDRMDAQEEGLVPTIVQHAGALGFCGPDTSADFGGLGLGKNLAARILEYLSLNASFSVTIGITSGISQVGLQLFGSRELQEKYLPPLCSGEHIGAYCLSEPNSGTDSLSLSTRADQHGGKWVLNGTKMWISNAKWANQFLVMAKVGGEKISAFLVERDFPGVSISREEHKMGLKGSSTARVMLENAEVPLENMVYEEGRGHIVAFNALNLGRFKLSSMSIGPARQAMTHASEYALDRKQFGQSIGRFGLIEQKFAKMAALFYAAESAIYRTGALIDSAFESGHAQYPDDRIKGNIRGAEEYSVECSICKVFSTEAEGQIVDECLQVYGGYGFTEEFPIARIYRDCRVSRIYEGTNEINRFFIADRLLRRMRAGTVIFGPGDGFIHDLCGEACALVSNLENPHQAVLGALADLAILTYVEQSARLRVSRNPAAFGQLHAVFCNWANAEAARAYQLISGNPVSLPAPAAVDLGAIAGLVYEKRGPVN